MVIILRGVSGSGKSILAELLGSKDFKFGSELEPKKSPAILYSKQLWSSFIGKEHKFYKLSADDFFMINGQYKFDGKLLNTAHTACLRNYYEVISDPRAVVVVDNTNCSIVEVAPYAALANAFTHELQIITLLTSPEVAWRRNRHDVPFASIAKQAYKLQDSINNWPSWFPQQIFPE